MEALTFEQLPTAVTFLTKEVSELKALLLKKSEQQSTQQQEQLLTIQQASELLNLSVPTLYSKVSEGELPVMKRSKHLDYSPTELLDSLKDDKIKSSAEIEAEADVYLSKKRIEEMETNNNHPLPKKQVDDTQLQKVYKALHNKPLTMKEVFVETGVLREFVCWYCRELRLSGKLYFVKKRRCSITKRYVKEFTTNEIFLHQLPKQLSLFE